MRMVQRTSATRRHLRRHGVPAMVFLAPFFLVSAVFILYPVGQAVYMGFFDFDLLTQKATNFGGQNYVKMFGAHGLTWSVSSMWVWRLVLLVFAGIVLWRTYRGTVQQRRASLVLGVSLLLLVILLGIHPGPGGRWNDPNFWDALKHTVEFTVFSTPLLVGLGLVLAMAVNRPGRLAKAYRTMFFLPYVLPVSVVTLIWIYLLNPGRGLISAVTDALGLESIDFLNSASLALPSVIVATVWWTVGFNLVLFLAGLQDIDPHLYEAANLDGAGRWAQFTNVTLPGLRRISVLVMVTQVVASFQVFGQIYIMTRGGPGNSSLVLIQNIYQTGIRDSHLGYASAQSVVLLAIILLASLALLRFMRQEP